jgi:hypothetical protein
VANKITSTQYTPLGIAEQNPLSIKIAIGSAPSAKLPVGGLPSLTPSTLSR